MRMTKLFVMGLLGWMVLPAWTKPLFECLPSEAMMVLHVKDTKLLMEQWEDTPFQRIFEDPKLGAWLESASPTDKKEDDKERPEMAEWMAALTAMFPGEVVLSWNDMSYSMLKRLPAELSDEERRETRAAMMNESMNEQRVVLIARMAGNPLEFGEGERRLLDLIKQSGTHLKPPRVEMIDGVAVNLYDAVDNADEAPMATAKVDDLFIAGINLASVSETLNRIKKGNPTESFASSRSFKKTSANHAVSAYVDVFRMYDSQKELAGGAGSPGVSMHEKMTEGLGIKGIKGLQLGLRFDGGFSIANAMLEFTERKGLLDVLAFQNDLVLRRSFIPKDTSSASISALSMEEMYEGFKETAEGTMPGSSAMFTGVMKLYETSSEHDFEKDVLGNMATEVITVSAGDESSDMAIMVKIEEMNSFKKAFDHLVGFIAGMSNYKSETLELHGLEAREITMPASLMRPEPTKMAYAYTRGYLVLSFGAHQTLGKVVAGFANPSEALWKQPRIKEAIRKLETDYVHLSYLDVPQMFEKVLSGFGGLVGLPTEGMPDLAYWRTLIGDAVMSVHLEQKRFVGRALLLPVE